MWRIKYIALAAAAAAAFAFGAAEDAAFAGLADEYEVWTGVSSSARMEVLDAGQYDRIELSSVGGVSCCVEMRPEDVLEKYRARVVRKETVCGVTSWYAYSPDLPFRVTLFGETVNLHVAQRADGAVKVGSPIIFGSF